MGRDKALLRWGDGDLLDHALARLHAVTEDARILCGPILRYDNRGVPVVADAALGLGPLGGLRAGLEAAGGLPVLLLAVDLPGPPPELLAHLLRPLREVDAVVPRSASGAEPLCAAYGPGCLGPIRRAIAARELSMTSFWTELRVLELTPAELAPYGEPARLFANLNGPEDYQAALAE